MPDTFITIYIHNRRGNRELVGYRDRVRQRRREKQKEPEKERKLGRDRHAKTE